MKKITALFLALIFALSLTTAFAVSDSEKEEWVVSKTEAVRTMLDDEGYKYEYNSGKNRFKAEFSIDGVMESVTLWAFVKYDLVEFNADYQVNAPEDMCDDVAVFFTRINSFFRIGQFYMEYDSGLMGYKIVVYTEEADPTEDCLYWALRLSVNFAEMVGDTLSSLLNGEITIDQAVEAVDAAFDS